MAKFAAAKIWGCVEVAKIPPSLSVAATATGITGISTSTNDTNNMFGTLWLLSHYPGVFFGGGGGRKDNNKNPV